MNIRHMIRILSAMGVLCLGCAAMGGMAAEASDRTAQGKTEYRRVFGGEPIPGSWEDPELAAVMKSLIHGDIASQTKLTDTQRQLVTIVTLAANQNQTMLGRQVDGALRIGVKPLEIREAVYQVAPYIGLPKAFEALKTMNTVFAAHGIAVPLPPQGTVTDENRLEKGLAIQTGIYGDRITQRRTAAPADERTIQDALSAYCFGDTYTRKTLDLPMRELLTMTVIASLGGADAQLKGHIRGNLTVGNDRETLVGTITELMPYIGFPRTLNALRAVDEIVPAKAP